MPQSTSCWKFIEWKSQTPKKSIHNFYLFLIHTEKSLNDCYTVVIKTLTKLIPLNAAPFKYSIRWNCARTHSLTNISYDDMISRLFIYQLDMPPIFCMSLDKIIEIAKWFSFQSGWKNWSILFTQKKLIHLRRTMKIKFRLNNIDDDDDDDDDNDKITMHIESGSFWKIKSNQMCIKYHFHVIANVVYGTRDKNL